jgi:hypothetical protein
MNHLTLAKRLKQRNIEHLALLHRLLLKVLFFVTKNALFIKQHIQSEKVEHNIVCQNKCFLTVKLRLYTYMN